LEIKMTTVSANPQAFSGAPTITDEFAHSSSPVFADVVATTSHDNAGAGSGEEGFQHWDATAHGAGSADALQKFGALFGMPPNVQRFYADPNGGGGNTRQANPKQANATNPPAGSIGSPPPSLQEGKSSGPEVTGLKGQLNIWREHQWHEDGNLGYPTSGLELNGKFDANTREALKAFQRQVGLPVTGVADAATQKLLKLENDRGYSLMVSASNRALIRQLFARPGLDGARMDAMVSLLTDSAFNSRTRSPRQTQTRMSPTACATCSPAMSSTISCPISAAWSFCT
jgi:peptidoglycan hydrolase-like protein with peptidoglycan-binding domain